MNRREWGILFPLLLLQAFLLHRAAGGPYEEAEETQVIHSSPLLQTSAQSRLNPSPFGSGCQMSCPCGHTQTQT